MYYNQDSYSLIQSVGILMTFLLCFIDLDLFYKYKILPIKKKKLFLDLLCIKLLVVYLTLHL